MVNNTISALEELRKSDKVFISPKEASTVLGVRPYDLNCAAHANPKSLPFEFMWTGSKKRRLRILRTSLLAFLDGSAGQNILCE